MVEYGEFTMETTNGNILNLIKLIPTEVDIIDIAGPLSRQCRYNGHIGTFYSVAQHSLIVSNMLPKPESESALMGLYALLHDAAEAYVGDIIAPIKRTLFVSIGPHVQISFNDFEQKILFTIFEAFHMPTHSPEIVNEIDLRVLLTEQCKYMSKTNPPYVPNLEPFDTDVLDMAYPPVMAEILFLRRFHDLYKQWMSNRDVELEILKKIGMGEEDGL